MTDGNEHTPKHVNAQDVDLTDVHEEIDAFGRPTGKMVIKSITYTLDGIQKFKAIIRNEEAAKYQTKIELLRTERDNARQRIKTLEVEAKNLCDSLRQIRRDYDENRIARLIADAVATQTEKLEVQLRAKDGEIATQKSEIAELREAKRRLRMSRQGSR